MLHSSFLAMSNNINFHYRIGNYILLHGVLALIIILCFNVIGYKLRVLFISSYFFNGAFLITGQWGMPWRNHNA